MASEVNTSNDNQKIDKNSGKSNSTKTFLAYASIIVGIVGLGLFFCPIPEILCGAGGLILSLLAKDKNASRFTKIVRSWGNNFAWINILWVCLEFGLKFAGIDLFDK